MLRTVLRSPTAVPFVLAGALSACSPEPDLELGESQRASWLAACDAQLTCWTNPNDVERDCEARYGSTSGKTYSVMSDCAPNSATSNSDCFSNCFRNACICGQYDGRSNGCQNMMPMAPDPAWGVCRCSMTWDQHNFWCCEAAPTNHTTDGWSCLDYCGAGNDLSIPTPADCRYCCSSVPPRGCNYDGACEPDQGESCETCVTDCCNPPPPAPPPVLLIR